MGLKINSKLDETIKTYQKKVSIKEDKDITIEEVMKSIGEYADVSWTTIKQLKNKDDMQPSLAVAIRIAEFFNTTVEELWTVEYEYSMIDEEKKPKKVNVKKEKPKCKHEDCERVAIARGLCNKHYQQFRKYHMELFYDDKPIHCTMEDCKEPYYAKGLCNFHYNRQYRTIREGGSE